MTTLASIELPKTSSSTSARLARQISLALSLHEEYPLNGFEALFDSSNSPSCNNQLDASPRLTSTSKSFFNGAAPPIACCQVQRRLQACHDASCLPTNSILTQYPRATAVSSDNSSKVYIERQSIIESYIAESSKVEPPTPILRRDFVTDNIPSDLFFSRGHDCHSQGSQFELSPKDAKMQQQRSTLPIKEGQVERSRAEICLMNNDEVIEQNFDEKGKRELCIPTPQYNSGRSNNKTSQSYQKDYISLQYKQIEESKAITYPKSRLKKRISCHSNRWLSLGMSLFITMTTGSFFFNWPATQGMILQSGAYAWLCSTSNNNHPPPISSSSLSSAVLLFPPVHHMQDYENQKLLKTSKRLMIRRLNRLLYESKEPTSLLQGRMQSVVDSNQQQQQHHYRMGDIPRVLLNDDEKTTTTCKEQLQAINSLMPIGVASWFLFSFVGGIITDLFGPKLTSLCGLFLSGMGWIVLGSCSQSLPIYTLAFSLIGSGIDIIFIGLLNTTNLFPNFKGTVVSVFNAARSLAFSIPSCVTYLGNRSGMSFQLICFFYSSFLGIWAIVVYFMIPTHPYPNNSQTFVLDEGQKEDNTTLVSHQRVESPFIKASSSPGNNDKDLLEDPKNVENFDEIKQCGSGSKGHFLCQACCMMNNLNKSSSASLDAMTTITENEDLSFTRRSTDIQYDKTEELYDELIICSSCQQISKNTTKDDMQHKKNRLQHTLSLLKSDLFYPLVPFAIFTILRGSFLSNSAVDQLDSSVSLFGILTPLSFIPAPFFGLIADKISIYFVFLLLNSIGLFQFFLLVTFPHQLLSVEIITILNMVVASFFLGQFYCYITISFPSEFVGTLVGITISVSGLFGLFVTPMYNFSLNAKNFRIMNSICLSLSVFSYLCIWMLWKAKKKDDSQSTKGRVGRKASNSLRSEQVL